MGYKRTKKYLKMLSDQKKGVLNPMSILKDDDIIEIRRLLKDGKKATQIATIFNCSVQNIYKIKYGHGWKHIS